MPAHQRRLPHKYAEGRALFLTWHLLGSLPHSRFPRPGMFASGKAFVWIDRHLDSVRTGNCFLRDERIAKIVVDAIHFGSENLHYYELYAYVVMANHVHLLIRPLVPPSKMLQTLKGFTAREANKILNRVGVPFWQRESYDHLVRDRAEFERIQTILNRTQSRQES
jgi:REP element-mobilizing transposase RayT